MSEDPIQRILKQIENLSQKFVSDDVDAKDLRILLTQLHERISSNEQSFKRQMKTMKEAQDSSFAELFLEKNDEIRKLRLEVEALKKTKKTSEESIKQKFSDELLSAMNETARLREMLKNRSHEIDALTYKLVDTQSYIKVMEQNKQNLPDCENDELIQNHFKTIRRALLSNRNLLKIMQVKDMNKSL